MSKLILMLCAAIAWMAEFRPAAADQKVFKNGRWVSLGETPDGDPDLQTVRGMISEGRYRQAYKTAYELAAGAIDNETLWEARMLLGDICVLTDEMSDARLHYDAVLNNAPENSRIYQD